MKKPKRPTPAQSSPLAQALVAGLLQGIGERCSDEAMVAEGQKLAQKAAGACAAPKPDARSTK